MMDRKHFLSSLMGISAAIPALGATGQATEAGAGTKQVQTGPATITQTPLIIPPYLKPGDTIGITCPAGAITLPEIQAAVQQLQSWGFQVKVGDTVGKKDFTFGGTDDERAADLQQMLNDPSLKAILCARGGYGAVHIVDRLDLTGLLTHPKWIIGFSDITVILCHLHRQLNMASIHSKMCNSFPDDWSRAEQVQIDSILSIRLALTGQPISYPVLPQEKNRMGRGAGPLVGGNLKTIESLSGSRSDINTAGKILFVEDTGEYLYSIDRMFWNLERTGKLRDLNGLVIGGFKVKPDDAGEEFGRTVYEIVTERVKNYSFPVCFDFPVGHQKSNFAIPYGLPHVLTVEQSAVSLKTVPL